MKNPYEDIIKLAYKKSNKYPHMPRSKRAGQFSPFAALTGYESVIKEASRITERRVELDKYIKEDLNKRLSILEENINDKVEISVSYFQEDPIKVGGSYIRVTGYIKKIDKYEGLLVMVDGEKIFFKDILEIDCELFKALK